MNISAPALSGKRTATFLLPVYRANPDYLKLTTDSIIRVAETLGDSEIIMFNDCSPDDSQTIIDDYAHRYPDLIIPMRSRDNLGVGRARTEMCKRSRGRYILSFDQDDIMLPFDLKSVVDMMDATPEYSASYSQKFLFNSQGLTGEVHGDALSNFNAFFTPKININAMVIRADTLRELEYFKPVENSPINDDVFLMFRLALNSKLHYDAGRPRTLYRDHEKQNSKLLDCWAQEPYRWMARQIVAKKPELYDIILNGGCPEVTDENRALIMSFHGLVLFLNQSSSKFMYDTVRKAIEIDPMDYGAWEHYIVTSALRGNIKDVDVVFEKAMAQFGDDLPKKFVFLNAKARAYSLITKRPAPPDLAGQIAELYRVVFKPPQIVLDNLPPCKPKSIRYTYSFT